MKINSSNLKDEIRDLIAKETIKMGRIPPVFLQTMTLAARKMVLRRAKYLKRHPISE